MACRGLGGMLAKRAQRDSKHVLSVLFRAEMNHEGHEEHEESRCRGAHFD